jgi:hypothetical protein
VERFAIAHRLRLLGRFLEQVEKLLAAGQNVLGASAADVRFSCVVVQVWKV